MKKILGLDIGTTSIGWAIVEATDEKKPNNYSNEVAVSDINNDRVGIYKDAVGVRIISQDDDRFIRGEKLNEGSTLTPAANRRKYRGSRRMNNRYKLRRDKLLSVVDSIGMLPEGSFVRTVKNGKNRWLPDSTSEGELYTKIRKFEIDENGKKRRIKRPEDIGEQIYALRSRASFEPVSLKEFGRILLHLNQWRGYSSDRFAKEEKQNFDYYTVEVVEIDETQKIAFNERGSNELKYYQFPIKVRFLELCNISEEGEDLFVNEVKGYLFKKEINFTKGDFITIKKPKLEVDKKNKQSYYKLTQTQPNPEDWNYKYQSLNKSLKEWCGSGGTVGTYFYENFYKNRNIERIRNNIVNRNWYEDEFEKIWKVQYGFHQATLEQFSIDEILKSSFKDEKIFKQVKSKTTFEGQLKYLIKNTIIYYQRPWQQTKNKGKCPFEKRIVEKTVTQKGFSRKESVKEYIGRDVIPRSHPLYQKFRIWQQINNVRILSHNLEGTVDLFADENKFGIQVGKTISEVKELLYAALQQKKNLSWRAFVKQELGLANVHDTQENNLPESYFSVNFRKRKKDGSYKDIELKGNSTKIALQKMLPEKNNDWFDKIAITPKKNSSEESSEKSSPSVSNLQLLWEIIYDITIQDTQRAADTIKKHFGSQIKDEVAFQLAALKFDDSGMGNLSAKAIRQLLPLMSDGSDLTDKAKTKIESLFATISREKQSSVEEKLLTLKDLLPDSKARLKLSKLTSAEAFVYLSYWEAAAIVYGSHSSLNIKATGNIKPIIQHSLNNPIVEKIVNETIALVNTIYKRYGFDEIRIELSRELRSSKDERQQMWENMLENADRNQWAKQMLRELKATDSPELDLEATNSNIEKIKVYEDTVRYKNADEYKAKAKEYKLGEPSKAEVGKYLHWMEQHFCCPYTKQTIKLSDVFSKNKTVEIEHIIPRERYYSNAFSNKVITWKEVNTAKGNRTAYEFIVSDRRENKIKLSNKEEVTLVAPEQWEAHVKSVFPPGAKRNNLLRKNIPEDPILRTLKETQYINKKLKEKLGEIVGSQKVWVTSGAITDMLRERWHLNDIMKELMRERFENFQVNIDKGVFETHSLVYWTNHYNSKTGGWVPVETFAGYSKRLDHRHHALDAIIIACTKQNHIQYINNLNTIHSAKKEDEGSKRIKYLALKQEICIGDSSKKFKTPWSESKFMTDVKQAMNGILVSHKNVNLLISPSKHNNKNISQKTMSIRGELHKDTNYAQKKYFEPGTRKTIDKVIEEILKRKQENQAQILVRYKTFTEIIKEVVLKEKYQVVLTKVFDEYEGNLLNSKSIKDIGQKIKGSIRARQLLFDTKNNKPFEWLSVYSDNNKASRPLGQNMDLNSPKEVKGIANPRIKRIAEYRLDYVTKKRAEIDNLDIEKSEKDQRRRALMDLPLYSNGLYEVRLKDGENYCWMQLKDLRDEDIANIEYGKAEVTERVKAHLFRIIETDFRENYFEQPIILSGSPILIKKVRQKSWFQYLYEVTKGRYVYSQGTYMVHLAEETLSGKRIPTFLKFLDATRLIDNEKPRKISVYGLAKETQNVKENQFLFALQKNDLVYLPEALLDRNQLLELDWNNPIGLFRDIYVVKDINESRNSVVFQQVYTADAIQINEIESKALFKMENISQQVEQIKSGKVDMLQKCVKVYTDKLGKKIIPYWEFPNGCWDNETAKRLGLI